jgi:hypothetical protein
MSQRTFKYGTGAFRTLTEPEQNCTSVHFCTIGATCAKAEHLLGSSRPVVLQPCHLPVSQRTIAAERAHLDNGSNRLAGILLQDPVAPAHVCDIRPRMVACVSAERPRNGTVPHGHPMWQPDRSHMHQVVSLLEQTQRPASNQRDVLDRLDEQRGSADFNNYLAYLFAFGDGTSEVVRSEMRSVNSSCCGGCCSCTNRTGW